MTTKDRKSSAKPKTRRTANSTRSAKAPARRTAGSSRPAKAPARRTAGNTRPVKAPVRRTVSPSRRRSESQVVYTPPKPFNKLRFLLGLATAAAVVLALTLGMSIFFKVEHIMVSGTQKYTAWDIREASGIREGDNLLTLGKARTGGKIIAQLPYVDSVRIGIKLPDTVNIEITELEILYTIQAADNSWWFINSQGRVLDQTTGIIAENFTQIHGVRLSEPVIGQPAVAVVEETTQQVTVDVTTPDGETETAPTAPVETVDAAAQLQLALTIIQQFENNGIIGDVNSVDVGNLNDLKILYDDRYEVLLGDQSQMSYKIRAMKEAIQQMTDYQQGILDVSFTTWPDRVGYTPFEN